MSAGVVPAEWLAGLPDRVREIAAAWQLDVGEPFHRGGRCSWVAPARGRDGGELAKLTGVDAARVRLWLFARCAQESDRDPELAELARRLAP